MCAVVGAEIGGFGDERNVLPKFDVLSFVAVAMRCSLVSNATCVFGFQITRCTFVDFLLSRAKVPEKRLHQQLGVGMEVGHPQNVFGLFGKTVHNKWNKYIRKKNATTLFTWL